MHTLFDPRWLPYLFGGIVQFVLFLRWIYRRIRNDEITRVFVEDMARNHLPHIYQLLERLCEEQGIRRAERPHIRWIDMNSPHH